MFEHNKPYAQDLVLLRSLGLPAWNAELHSLTFIGEVHPFGDEDPEGQKTVIRCFVNCHPAQFWKFEVIRRSEEDGYDGMEQIEITTGSGLLSNYYPMALAVANNVLNVGVARKLDVH